MTTIQEYCATTGRELTATPPMAVAAQPLTWEEAGPWQRIESPDPAAVIYVTPAASTTGFSPNAFATCLRVAPPMDAEEAVQMIADTASGLQDWVTTEFVAGEGDEEVGAPRSVYRFLGGTFTAEPGHMATSSLIVAWSDAEATHLFQYIVTGYAEDVAEHRDALDCPRIGEWTANEILDAMRG